MNSVMGTTYRPQIEDDDVKQGKSNKVPLVLAILFGILLLVLLVLIMIFIARRYISNVFKHEILKLFLKRLQITLKHDNCLSMNNSKQESSDLCETAPSGCCLQALLFILSLLLILLEVFSHTTIRLAGNSQW